MGGGGGGAIIPVMGGKGLPAPPGELGEELMC